MRYHVDGSLVDAEAATLPVDDRGVTFGDAVREPLRVADGTSVAWDAHVDRLFDACDALGFAPGVDGAELRNRVDDTLAANGLDDALVRLSITRGRGQETGAGPLGHHRPPPDPEPTVVVTVDPLSSERDPVTLQTVSTRPIRPAAVSAAPVTHNCLDAVRAQAELRQAAPPDDDPAEEALLLDGNGHVVGGTTSDPVCVADDALRLPALGEWPVRTATRGVVLDLARAEGLPVVEGDYTPADFRAADEAFVADPTAGIRPVSRIDGVDVGGGPVTRLLAHLYDERVVGGD